MKNNLLKLAIVFASLNAFPASAQLNQLPFKKLPFNSGFRNDVQKVIADYPANFKNIKGTIIAKNPQSIVYQSSLKLSDAQYCSVTEYSSGIKWVYSWQALMLVTEDFETAAKKYKALFQQLRGMNVYYIKDQYTLEGRMDEASESKGFATSTLQLSVPPEPLKKLKLDVTLQFEFPEWKVSLMIYEKEKEDTEPGGMYE